MYRSVKPFIYVTAILLVGLFVADCFDRNQASALTPLAQEAAVATEAAETVETSMPAVEVVIIQTMGLTMTIRVRPALESCTVMNRSREFLRT